MRRSKERIKLTGEVFTPREVVMKMINRDSINYSDPELCFIDRACGNGNFLVEIVSKKIECGLTPWQALSTTFGVDIMEDNVLECRERLLKVADTDDDKHAELVKHTIICGDSVKNSIESLFSEYVRKYKQVS